MKMKYGLLDAMRNRGILNRRELEMGVQVESLPASRGDPLPIIGEGEMDRYGVWEIADPHSEDSYRLVLDRMVIKGLLARLDERERAVIIRTSLGNEVLADLAQEWGVTESRASQIRTGAITQMRVWMHEPSRAAPIPRPLVPRPIVVRGSAVAAPVEVEEEEEGPPLGLCAHTEGDHDDIGCLHCGCFGWLPVCGPRH
jgi:hypothetical protein